LENVPGIRQHANRVFAELAARRYDARWLHFSAEQVGAPHRRERWWCLAADTDRIKLWQQSERNQLDTAERGNTEPRNNGTQESLANATSGRHEAGRNGVCARQHEAERGGEVADTESERRREGRAERSGQQREPSPISGGSPLAYADSEPGRQEARHALEGDGAKASRSGETEPGRRSSVGDADGERQLQPQGGVSAEWRRVGNPSWWSVEPDVGRVANGIPKRVDRLRSLGNAVVPAQARKAFEILLGLAN
jgi:DNA (cytosine-5)-methyltransferase 1